MAQGHGFDSEAFTGLDARMQSRIRSMIGASGGRLWIVSGYRSKERQQQLWNQALQKYGSEAAARKWVADPNRGKGSNHMHGLAVDIGGTPEGMEWMAANLPRFGLWRPMDHEPWHVEAVNTAVDWNPDAYTDPPLGAAPVGDPSDPGFQFNRLIGMLDSDEGIMANPGTGIVESPVGELDVDEGAGVRIDSGASMKSFGFRDEPDEMQAELEEALDV